MRKLACILVVAALAYAAPAATYTLSYGWEDGGTILGSYGSPIATNVTSPDPVYELEHSLKLERTGTSTPQGYVGWVEGLETGDVIEASFYVYDVTPSAPPSGRIWGHYTAMAPDPMSSDPADYDVSDYGGSAGGNSDYGPGTGWCQLSWTWVFDESNPGYDPHTGFVLEARVYSNAGDIVWFDAMEISVTTDSSYGFVMDAGGNYITIPEPASLLLLGLGAVAVLRRR